MKLVNCYISFSCQQMYQLKYRGDPERKGDRGDPMVGARPVAS